ncbi:hypothetical protein FHS74_004183 [Nitrospirillum iridis]|uniref:Uncharacterized protein n=1 Tax=Nitrospirillum iridis TaxID=765888 RepID=A0A7X0B3L3_9PROT|nr:hypothetical protein [Nitrospirillum iridis]
MMKLRINIIPNGRLHSGGDRSSRVSRTVAGPGSGKEKGGRQGASAFFLPDKDKP